MKTYPPSNTNPSSLLPEEMILSARSSDALSPSAPVPAQVPGATRRPHAFSAEDAAPALWPWPSGGFLLNKSSASNPRAATAVSIYVVDDSEFLTELYRHFLKGTGYAVRAFNRRAEALAALMAERTKPDLLVIDYLGDSLPVDRFMQSCLAVHPSLRILMATGLSKSEARFSGVRPNRFIQKPFTAEEFLHEVKAALAL